MEELSNLENFNTQRYSGFRDWVFEEGLVDLGFTGSKHTWIQGQNEATFQGARLDRALSNLE